MQPLGLLLQIVIDAAADAFRAPCRPLGQDIAHAQHDRRAGDQDIKVAAERVHQRRRAIELLHDLLRIGAALEIDRELQTVQIGLVAHVGDLTQLARLDQLRHLVDDRLGGGGIGDLVDLDEVPLLDVAPLGADAERTASRFVDRRHLRRVVEDLAAGREIRRGHDVEDVRLRIADQRDRRLPHLAQIEAADVRRHADRDAHIRRHKDIRERRRQQRRLSGGGIVIVHKVDRVGVDVAEQLRADGIEFRLGIARSGIRHIAGIDLAEVALAVHKRVQQRLVPARKAHHRVVDGGVAVRVELHRLPDDVGGLDLPAAQQSHLVHRVKQLAVRRLEAVDLRDRTRDDHAHRVGHVVDFQRLADRLLQHLGAQALDVLRDLGAFFHFFGFFLPHFGTSEKMC